MTIDVEGGACAALFVCTGEAIENLLQRDMAVQVVARVPRQPAQALAPQPSCEHGDDAGPFDSRHRQGGREVYAACQLQGRALAGVHGGAEPGLLE